MKYLSPFFLLFTGLISLLSVSTGCLRVTEFDLPISQKRLVVNGTFSNDIPLKIQVTSSLPPDTNLFYQPVLDAKVEIFQGNNQIAIIDSIAFDTETPYFSSQKPLGFSEGLAYRLIVSAPGYDTIQAEDIFPDQLVETKLEFTQSEFIFENRILLNNQKRDTLPSYNLAAELKLELSPTNNPSYLGVRVYAEANLYVPFYSITDPSFERMITDSIYESKLSPHLITSSGIIENFRSYPFDNDFLFITDSLTNSKVSMSFRGDLSRKGPPPDSLTVEIWTLSKNYYDYQLSFTQQAALRQDPFSEPLNVVNNIEGGYGIWGGYQIVRKKIALE